MQKSMQLRYDASERTYNQRGRSSEGILTNVKNLTSISIIPSATVDMQQCSTLYVTLIHRTGVCGNVEVAEC